MKPNFFDQGSPYLHHPLLTPERTAQELDFVLSLIDIKPGDKILDIGCGTGRHSIELSRRGLNVLGIDPSEVMIAAARERAAGESNNQEFLQMKGEDFQRINEFDASICLFTTLGQVIDREDNRQLLHNAARSLRPGGYFIVEVPQPGWVESNLKTHERFGEGETYTEVERSYDKELKLVTEMFTQVSPKSQRTYLLRYRLFNQTEIRKLLVDVGFIDITFYGGYERIPLAEDCPTMVASARKRPQ
jgi:ubiquinone/menaquinone biosynthesis C-methylase UbiE